MFDRVLVLGAHTDDIELMCGGTLIKLKDLGADIYYSTFSFAVKSLPMEFSIDATKNEVCEATKVLEIPPNNLYLYDYEVRVFPSYRQEILEDLVKLRKEIKPSLVITHNSSDTHQDHKIISDETFRAFKLSSTIWGYESFKNNKSFDSDLYVHLTKDHIEKKVKSLSKYKSQIVKYDYKDAVIGLAHFRGAQINTEYAECFEIMRAIL